MKIHARYPLSGHMSWLSLLSHEVQPRISIRTMYYLLLFMLLENVLLLSDKNSLATAAQISSKEYFTFLTSDQVVHA